MKIRIKGNSIRFRLTRVEVESLSMERPIIESTDLGEHTLFYKVTTSSQTGISVNFDGWEIVLAFPQHFLHEWKSTDKIGYEATQGALSILIEKDFTCLDNTMEDQSDNYPNPLLEKNQWKN